MDEKEKELELEKKMQLIAAECGDEINQAIPMYEDPTRYSVKDLLKMSSLQWKMMEAPTAEERAALKKEFAEVRKQIRLLPDAPERIYLWKEGNMPVQTVYTENLDTGMTTSRISVLICWKCFWMRAPRRWGRLSWSQAAAMASAP